MTRDDLPKISKDDASWLSDNPNTSDVVEWVQDYALQCIAALRAPAVTGEVYPNSDRGLREMCPGVPVSILRGIQEAAFRAGREDMFNAQVAAPPAAWAPPALVALVERLQTAMRSFKGWTQAGMPRTADHFEDKARAALDDVLAWSPAPAPVAPPAETFKPPMGVCQWIDDTGDYTTECGHVWQFIDGDVALNDAKFCPFCGGKIQVVDDPPAPPAVAGGDAPEIQVGDWVRWRQHDGHEYWTQRLAPSDVAVEIKRHGVVIWRRRHQSR